MSLMGFDVDKLVEEACTSEVVEFYELIEKVREILIEERDKKGSFISLPPREKLTVIGDLHGDLDSLEFILKHLKGKNTIFLGDYGDRGLQSPEVYYILLKLKESYSGILLLRGNHEGPQDLLVYPHDLPYILERKYADGGNEIYQGIRNLWGELPHGALVEGKYLFLHGGAPATVTSMEDIVHASELHPSKRYLEEILWNDPMEIDGTMDSPRGSGKLFGRDVTQHVLNLVGAKTLIRSHEPCNGVSVSHEGKVLTLFSRKGPPYYNRYGAYLEIDLKEKARNAYELAEKAHKF